MHIRRLILSLAVCASGAVVQGQDAPATRTVAYHGPQGDMLLRPSFLFPEADAHFAVFPMFVREDRYQPVVREGRVSIG